MRGCEGIEKTQTTLEIAKAYFRAFDVDDQAIACLRRAWAFFWYKCGRTEVRKSLHRL